MTISTAVAAARALSDRMMPDTCTITRPSTAAGTFDSGTGLTTPTAPTTVYTGRCRAIPIVTTAVRDDLIGEQTVSTRWYSVALPIEVVNLEIDDVCTITASEDPGFVSTGLRVADIRFSTYGAARRLVCVDDMED